MEIIQLNNITKKYKNKVIFSDVNLTIPSSSFTVLMGESGSGKTTLLNIIGGLEPQTSGEVVIEQQNIKNFSARQRADFYRHKVGLIFQGSYLQPQLTLFENISLPGVFAKMPRAERDQRVRELARNLGISEVLNNLPSQVSGGQAERACIARALLLNPKIILADEPTSNLDEKNANIILHLLNNIRLQQEITVVVSSHSQLVARFATQLVTVKNGTIYVQ